MALTRAFKSGKQSRIWCISKRFKVLAKYGVPFLFARVGYFLCKNVASSFIASCMSCKRNRNDFKTRSLAERKKNRSTLLSFISFWDLLTTPMIPNLTGITLPHKISIASVPEKIDESSEVRIRLKKNFTYRHPLNRAWSPPPAFYVRRDRIPWQVLNFH